MSDVCLVLADGRAFIPEEDVWEAGLFAPEDFPTYVEMPSDTAQVRPLVRRVAQEMCGHGYPARDVFAVKLALEEALINAIRHGNGGAAGKKVRVQYRVEAQVCTIDLADEGPGFDPEAVPDPRTPAHREAPGGRGLLLMRHYLSEIHFHPPGNHLTLIKRRTSPQRDEGNK